MSTARRLPLDGIADAQNFMERLQEDTRGYEKLSSLLKTHAGINMVLNDKNLTLMASRLQSILKARSYTRYTEYYDFLTSGAPGALTEFISALTTNTTQFFREPVHFDALRVRVAEVIEARQHDANRELRVWCSAASTGQEVYTMMMVLLDELAAHPGWSVKFLATDIDPEVLDRAARGQYQENEMSGVPEAYRHRYFERVQSGGVARYQVKRELQTPIRFATFNLLTDRYPFQFPFDIVFCRNVLIYFDRPTAEGVIHKLGRALRPGGFLFLGHSETGMMKSPFLKNVSSALYRRADE